MTSRSVLLGARDRLPAQTQDRRCSPGTLIPLPCSDWYLLGARNALNDQGVINWGIVERK